MKRFHMLEPRQDPYFIIVSGIRPLLELNESYTVSLDGLVVVCILI